MLLLWPLKLRVMKRMAFVVPDSQSPLFTWYSKFQLAKEGVLVMCLSASLIFRLGWLPKYSDC